MSVYLALVDHFSTLVQRTEKYLWAIQDEASHHPQRLVFNPTPVCFVQSL